MAQVTPSEFRRGIKVNLEGQPYEIIEFQFVKPGKGVAFTRTRFKHLLTGNVIDMNVRSGEKIDLANTETHEMTFLYMEGDAYTFMNTENFEQVQIDKETLGDAAKYLVENVPVDVLFYNDRPIGVDLPNFVTLQITYCEPGIKGDTATGATKPATLSTGAVINVPLFVEQGEWIRIDTRSDSYMERVKK
jgi:elongation factor P